MKQKWIFILLILVVSGLLINKEYKAETVKYDMSNSMPRGLNYLDMRYLEYVDWSLSGNVSVPIMVKNNTEYTLIISRDILGIVYENEALLDVEIKELPNETKRTIHLEKKATEFGEIGFVTFKTQSELVLFTKLPMHIPKSKDMMLIEGSISDFVGFEDYYGPRKEKGDLDGVVFTDESGFVNVMETLNGITVNNGQEYTCEIKEDNYTDNFNIHGDYLVKAHIKTDNKIYVYNLVVKVTDLINPELSGNTKIYAKSDKPMDKEDIIKYFTIKDNTTNYEDLIVGFEYNDYFGNETKQGTYEGKLVVTDKSGNEASIIFVVSVDIEAGRVLVGPSTIYLYNHEEVLSFEDIISRYRIIDGVNQDSLSYEINSNTYNEQKEPGKYTIKFTVKYQMTPNYVDYRYHELFIIVMEQDETEFNMPALVLNLDVANQMKPSEIKDYIIEKLKGFNKNASNIRIKHDEYSANKDKEGTYYVYYDYELFGVEKTDKLKIVVGTQVSNNYSGRQLVLPIVVGVVIIGAVITFVVSRKRKKSN